MRKEIIVEDFSGGIANDIREQSSSGFAISQHFDNTSSPKKLVPFRDSEDINTGHVGIMDFAWDGDYVYGMGVVNPPVSGAGELQLYRTTTADDLTSAWLTPSDSTSTGASGLIGNTLHIYKGYLYHMVRGLGLNRFSLSGGGYDDSYNTFFVDGQTDGSAKVTRPVTHSKTDIMYIGYYTTANGGRIFSLNNSTATTVALQLPTGLIPVSCAEYGAYLAIGCRPANDTGNSKIFLWDMFSADITDVIDLGVGDLWLLANVEGRLVAVMAEPTSGGVTFNTKKVYIKTYAGGVPQLFRILEDEDLELLGTINYKASYSNINGLTFGLKSSGDKVPTGLYTFSLGVNGQFQVTCERKIHNDDTITSLVGIHKVGQVVFTAYNYVADTSSSVGRTDNADNYNYPAFVETVKYNCGSINKNKRLVGISVSHEPLTSGQTVTVKYRKDSETSYTTIGSNTTVGSVFKEYITEGTVGKNLPEFHEIQFKIESTGGAKITGWRKVYEEKDTLLDDK